MHDVTIAFIGRAVRYSPNSIEADRAILMAVYSRMRHDGFRCLEPVSEDCSVPLPEADIYVTMGRSEGVLRLLARQETERGVVVINSPQAIRQTTDRLLLAQRMEQSGIAMPPSAGDAGYWVKRGQGCSETADDVVFAANRQEAERAAQQMLQRGLSAEIRAHVKGDLLKCYGVQGTNFCRHYYPTADGLTKFGQEQHNGQPHYYSFDEEALNRLLQRAADAAGLDIYGADCIIRPDGRAVLIDLNDWPSFRRCRDEAAEAIVRHIRERIENGE